MLADPCEACAASATYGGITSRQVRSDCTKRRLGPSSSPRKTPWASSTSSAHPRWTEVHPPTRVPRLVLDTPRPGYRLAATANGSTVWSTALAMAAVATLLPSDSSYTSLPGGLLVNRGIGNQLDFASGDGAWGSTLARLLTYMFQYTCCGHSLRLLPEPFVSECTTSQLLVGLYHTLRHCRYVDADERD
ncbi:hypothetical protein EV121DRAFT_281368 [Schizophyllum commune]